MSLADSGLKALLPNEKKYRVSADDAVYVFVHPNGGKYLFGDIGSHMVVVVSRGGIISVRMDLVQGNGPSRQHGMRRIVWTCRGMKGKTSGQ